MSSAGPSTSWPRPSIDRLSTSPFRKSAWVVAWKNFGEEALINTPPPRTLRTQSNNCFRLFKEFPQRPLRPQRWRCLLRNRDRQRLRSADSVLGGELPFTECCVG